MANPRLGAHVSVAGGLPRAFARAGELDCAAIQIFVKNANQWQAPPLADAEAGAFREARAASGVSAVVAHASYLINLAARDETVLGRSRAALVDELARCRRLGVDGLVLHPGAHLGAGEEAGIARMTEEIDRALAGLDREVGALAAGGGPRLLLENTAGQGSHLGHRLEQLAAIRSGVAEPARVGVCLDTCHAFAAGYPIHEAAGWEEFCREVEATVGLGTVACWHVNDSVKPFASRRDRHAHVGEGEIGLPAFARLLRDPRFAAVPMILETEPGPDSEGHRRDLETLRSLA